MPDLIIDEQQGAAVAEALGAARALVLRNHGVLVAGRRALGGARQRARSSGQSAAVASRASLGPLRPIPELAAGEIHAVKYQHDFVDEYWEAWIRTAPQRPALRDAGSRDEDIRLTVNGADVARVEPQELLLDFLRDRLGLTGAKRSCEVQVCGACTVLVDGVPVSSCTFLAADAHGREVLTIEGLPSSRVRSASRRRSCATPPCSAASARRGCC